MKNRLLIVVLGALAALVLPLTASAARVWVGVGGPYYYPGYAYGWPYPYPPAYYYAPPPAVSYEPMITAPAASYWYWCAPTRAYYPYAQTCPVAWQAVPARPQARAGGQPAPGLPAPSGGPVTFGLGDVLFDTAKSDLRHEADATLNSVVVQLSAHPDRHIKIEGHTDNRGGLDYNLGLSQRRAEAVRAYLVAHGIADSRISVRGMGEADPVASNATAEGRQRNRRVDVTLG